MIRLFVSQTLLTGSVISLPESGAHYVRHVMRLGDGDAVAAFNGNDGEWEARLELRGKRDAALAIGKKIADAKACPNVSLAFAMIKNKSELVVEKATELGVRAIHAIVMQHSVVKNVNLEKLEAHAVEAAEQCERFDVPTITPHKNLANFLGSLPKDVTLLYGDESGTAPPPVGGRSGGRHLRSVLQDLGMDAPTPTLPLMGRGCCILIGPEGGFSKDEHYILKSMPNAIGFGMGPRILRADTAAVAALACVMQAVGDWNEPPHFKG